MIEHREGTGARSFVPLGKGFPLEIDAPLQSLLQ